MLRSSLARATRPLCPLSASAAAAIVQPRIAAAASSSAAPIRSSYTAAGAVAVRCYSVSARRLAPATESTEQHDASHDAFAAHSASSHSHEDRPRSATQLVADVLRSGPKTRAQIFFAINRGPPMSRPIVPDLKPNPNRYKKGKNLINQHPQPAPHTFQIIQKKQAELVKATLANQVVEKFDPLVYPSGPLRSPAHLTNVLQTMLKGKRLHAKPFKSVAQWYGAAEAASTQEILERLEPEYLASRKAKLLAEGKTEIEAEQILAAGPRVSPLLAGPQSPKAHGRPAQQYVYVLRDWADKRYEAKAPLLQERGRLKKERREKRFAERAEAALPHNIEAAKEAEVQRQAKEKEAAAKDRVRMWRAHALNMSDEQQAQFLAEKRREDAEDEAEAAAQR